MRVAVLASGRGSNLQALVDARFAGALDIELVGVFSDKSKAIALERARTHGIPATALDPRDYYDRLAFDEALFAQVDAAEPALIVCAGYMRLISSEVVERYAGRMINIHPSLLPAYPGVDTHRRALADGVRIHGCTVHFVTSDVDCGPIVAQAAVTVRQDDDEAALAARVLAVEHRLLVGAVRWFCSDRLSIEGSRVRIRGEIADPAVLQAPSDKATNSPPS